MYVSLSLYIYIYIHIYPNNYPVHLSTSGISSAAFGKMALISPQTHNDVHSVRIARIRCPRFVPRVGLPRHLFLIGNNTKHHYLR